MRSAIRREKSNDLVFSWRASRNDAHTKSRCLKPKAVFKHLHSDGCIEVRRYTKTATKNKREHLVLVETKKLVFSLSLDHPNEALSSRYVAAWPRMQGPFLLSDVYDIRSWFPIGNESNKTAFNEQRAKRARTNNDRI